MRPPVQRPLAAILSIVGHKRWLPKPHLPVLHCGKTYLHDGTCATNRNLRKIFEFIMSEAGRFQPSGAFQPARAFTCAVAADASPARSYPPSSTETNRPLACLSAISSIT